MRSLLALALLLLPAAAHAQAGPFSHAERFRATFPDSVQVRALGLWPGDSGDTAALLAPTDGPGLRLLRLTPHADGAEILSDVPLLADGTVTAGFVEPSASDAAIVAVLGTGQVWVARLAEDGTVSGETLPFEQPTVVHGVTALGDGAVLVAGSLLDSEGARTEGFVGVARDGAWASTEQYPTNESTWTTARVAPGLDGGALVLWRRWVADPGSGARSPGRAALSLFRYGPDGARISNAPVGVYTNEAVDVLDDPRGIALVFATGLDAQQASATTFVPDTPFVNAVVKADGRTAIYPHPAVAQGSDDWTPGIPAGGAVLGGATVWLVSQGSSETLYTCATSVNLVQRRIDELRRAEGLPPETRASGPRLVAGARFYASATSTVMIDGVGGCSSNGLFGPQTRRRLALLLLDADGSIRQQVTLDDLAPTRNERIRAVPDGLRIETVASLGAETIVAVHDIVLR